MSDTSTGPTLNSLGYIDAQRLLNSVIGGDWKYKSDRGVFESTIPLNRSDAVSFSSFLANKGILVESRTGFDVQDGKTLFTLSGSFAESVFANRLEGRSWLQVFAQSQGIDLASLNSSMSK